MNTESVPIVEVYTRHSSDCTRADDRYWKRCRCPKWLNWRDTGKAVRQSAKTRSWERALESARRVEEKYRRAANGDHAAVRDAITVEQAVSAFLDDKKQQQSGEALIGKLTRLLDVRLKDYCKKLMIRRVDAVSLADLEAFRKTWPGNALTKKKTQEHLRSFFGYCLKHGWIQTNPAALLSRIKVEQQPTDYFTREEFDKIIKACNTYRPTSIQLAPRREKVKALTLLMRWSGLRIGDAIKLERHRLQGNKLLLRTEKTGTPVYCPLPPEVAEQLRKLESLNPAFFFWTGNSSPKTVYGDWHRTFQSVFAEARLGKRCHPHMFRDTFAVEMLLAGVPLEQVSTLLGHKSIKTTEKHYSPWVRARQNQLEQSVMKAWAMQSAKTKKAAR